MSARVGLIDLDGVGANFNDAFRDMLNTPYIMRDWKHFQSPEGPTTWDWPQAIGFSQVEVDLAWSKVRNDPGFWTRLETYPGFQQFLRDLKNAEYGGRVQPYFVTNRIPALAAAATNAWLDFNGYPNPNVIAVAKSGTKHLIAEAVGADFIIDDYWKNFDDLHPSVRRYLVDRPWNRDYKNSFVTRVKDAGEALLIELEAK